VTQDKPERPAAFGALLGASSLIIAILYVSGFAYRWSYYYNFGVQHLVYDLNFQSFLVTAIEMIRQPANIPMAVLVVGGPLVTVNLLVYVLRRATSAIRPGSRTAPRGGRASPPGPGSRLGVDVLRAAVIVYFVYMLSAQLGYEGFQQHVVNSPDNTLPTVTVILPGRRDEVAASFACAVPPGAPAPANLIGNPKRLRLLQEAYQACNADGFAWRLLYRDNESVVVFRSTPDIPQRSNPGPEHRNEGSWPARTRTWFEGFSARLRALFLGDATTPADGRRPAILVLPNSPETYLMMP
jgi:hypothetical protein